MPVQFTASVNFDRLADAVLAGRGVEHEQHLVRRGGKLLADRVLDFRQLGHEVLLRLQPAGRIDDAHIDAGFDGLLDRPIGDAGRVAAGRAGDDRHAEPIAPDRELLDGRGAERVAGAEEHASCPAT